MSKPQRRCVACRASDEKERFFRLRKTLMNTIEFDEGAQAPGRGAYVCRTESCIEKALKKKLIERSLKALMPPETAELLRNQIEH